MMKSSRPSPAMAASKASCFRALALALVHLICSLKVFQDYRGAQHASTSPMSDNKATDLFDGEEIEHGEKKK